MNVAQNTWLQEYKLWGMPVFPASADNNTLDVSLAININKLFSCFICDATSTNGYVVSIALRSFSNNNIRFTTDTPINAGGFYYCAIAA